MSQIRQCPNTLNLASGFSPPRLAEARTDRWEMKSRRVEEKKKKHERTRRRAKEKREKERSRGRNGAEPGRARARAADGEATGIEQE